MQHKLGILAGGGSLPRSLADHCQFIGREYFLIAFKGHADESTFIGIPHVWSRLGAAGKIIKRLKNENVQDLVMVGPVRRPSILTVFPDWRGIKFILRVGRRVVQGDNSLLSAIAEEFEREGFKIVGIDELLRDLLAPNGVFGRIKPGHQMLDFIHNGIQEAQSIGRRDIGQAIVILKDNIIGTEDARGTDDLITRCCNKGSNGVGPILIKAKKPNQDRRVDLPTIGVQTVQLAAECGFAGIAVEAGQTLVVDISNVTSIANKNGLFVMGIKLRDDE